MKWVTTAYPHLDRTASPWLIKRFIDPKAEFLFLKPGEKDIPAGATPFAVPGIPGSKFGPHDDSGTTFHKLVVEHNLMKEPGMETLDKVVDLGVKYVTKGFRPEKDDRYGQIGAGVLAVADGMLLINETDIGNVERNIAVWDALYANFKAQALMESQNLKVPTGEGRGPGTRVEFLRKLLKSSSAGSK